jgi:hypothetical protein
MRTWILLVRHLFEVLELRRNRWIEISVERAWSHDMSPALFDFGDS